MRFIRRRLLLLAFILTLSISVGRAWATKITMKDGTVLQGTTIRQPNGYWIKTEDGESQVVSDDDIASVVDDNGAAAQPTQAGAPDAAAQSALFIATHNRAEDCETAAAAVAVWQQFIDKNPGSPDLDQAKDQLAHWKTMADQNAEKINGQWVSGDELKKKIEQSDDLTHQAIDLVAQSQTLKAVDKLKAALLAYPNSFMANAMMGDVSMFEKEYDRAAQYYAIAAHLQPQCSEVVNNLALAAFFQKRFEFAITELQHAAEIEDSRPVAQNLVTALSLIPQDVRSEPRLRDAIQAANLLAIKWQIDGPAQDLALLAAPLMQGEPGGAGAGADQSPPVGWSWSGSGFFLNDSGLIITNRHVVKDSKSLMVVMNDGTQVAADVVAVDDDMDLALIHVKTKDKTPFVQFSADDTPREGADCVVLGFPMIDRLGADIKITRGIISSASQDQGNGADVLTDAKVNPGNSGGPILDKFGNLIAIVSMKSLSTSKEDSYGIGISAGHIRKFLQKNNVTLTPSSDQTPLSTEDIVTRIKPATVCILANG